MDEKKKKLHGMYLLSYDLATIPSAVEKKVSSRICGVPGGNQAINVQWPVETFLLFKLGDFN